VKRVRIVVLVLVALAAGLGWLAVRQSRRPTFTMPDGNHFYFLGITSGTNVQMNLGSPTDRVLGQLPGKTGRKFQRNVWTDESTTDTLVFWFEFERAPSTNLLVEVLFKDPAQRHYNHAESWLPAQKLPNGRIVASCGLSVWPRQEKTLTVWVGTSEDKPKAIRLSTPQGDQLLDEPGEFMQLGELTVKNPAYTPGTNSAGR
jgi:hypothetical protein